MMFPIEGDNDMTKPDRDEEVRDRAYLLWEEAGRPSGREHEFWAQASREIEGVDAPEQGPERRGRSVAR
ncbi:hypothetical protein ASG54_08825 [Aureimonas sp. Leaf460]|nr:hypothetical protein ASG54_08825 [Aureimonas sp. Leaf460]